MTVLSRCASWICGGFIGGCAVGVAVVGLTVLRERQERKQATR